LSTGYVDKCSAGDRSVFETREFYLACYLRCAGYDLIAVQAEGHRKVFDDRCWLNGLGWHLIGSAGQLLDRSLVDRMVAYGERLCFESAPIVEPPLAQDPSRRIAEAFQGEAIDTGLVVPRLTEYERHRVEETKAASAEALGKAAAEIRTRHDRTLAEKIKYRRSSASRSSRRCGWSRHAIAAFFCPTSNWNSIISAS
jgi:hypothetical protein